MRIFPGWREVGQAMRWARRQKGVTYTRTFFEGTMHAQRPKTMFTDNRWRRDDHSAEVMVSHAEGADGLDVRIDSGRSRCELTDLDAATVLRLLVALDLTPAHLPKPGARTDAEKIRDWARARGHTVNDAGPIPKLIKAAYREAVARG